MIGKSFTVEQVDRLGNTIIYLSERIAPLSKTKLLKLIYLIEEVSIKKTGIPFFNIPFEVWKLGPVAREVFIELDSVQLYLNGYFKVIHKDDKTFVKSIKGFDDNEFSDNDIEILDWIINKFKNFSANQLIDLTHSPNSIWTKYATKYNLIEAFESGRKNSSNIEMDMSDLLQEDSLKRMLYNDYIEYFEASRSLNS
jgi:uncharacterized phage-associated protein